MNKEPNREVVTQTFYTGDCIEVMKDLSWVTNTKVDGIITSPPYNMTKRKGGPNDVGRYDMYKDTLSYDEYLDWTVDVFEQYDNILDTNGVILYNFSYSVENPSLPYQLITKIIENTPFTLADTIIWKKSNSMPYPTSPNRLQRIWEFVYVLVRKTEIKTFNTNKQVSSISEKTKQKYYKPVSNFIVAKNNDGNCDLNKATFSTELVEQLIDTYFKEYDTILDSFGGTGTTMKACGNKNMNGISIEISKAQTDYGVNRL